MAARQATSAVNENSAEVRTVPNLRGGALGPLPKPHPQRTAERGRASGLPCHPTLKQPGWGAVRESWRFMPLSTKIKQISPDPNTGTRGGSKRHFVKDMGRKQNKTKQNKTKLGKA